MVSATLAAQQAQGGGGISLLFPLVLLAAMVVLFMRSNRKRQQQAQQVQSRLLPGAEVMTTAGIFGTVRDIADDGVNIEVSPGVTMRFSRSAIARVVTPVEPAEGEPGTPNGLEGLPPDDQPPVR